MTMARTRSPRADWRCDRDPLGRCYAGRLNQPLATILIQRHSQCQWVRPRVGYVEHFERRRHPRLTRSADPRPLSKIEDEVRRIIQQMSQHRPTVTQYLRSVPQLTQHRSDRLDRLRLIKLLLRIVQSMRRNRRLTLNVAGDPNS